MTENPGRYVCVHGHFYQPPRENPWLEAIELQDSAYPYHDWNERVTAECYGPNARSRILDSDGRIRQIANNYARISYNIGPTLLQWLADEDPEVYDKIIVIINAAEAIGEKPGAIVVTLKTRDISQPYVEGDRRIRSRPLRRAASSR